MSGLISYLRASVLLDVLQLVFAGLLMVAILLQQRGTGLGGAFGGDNSMYRTVRGVEKVLFRATIAIAVLLFATALLNVLF